MNHRDILTLETIPNVGKLSAQQAEGKSRKKTTWIRFQIQTFRWIMDEMDTRNGQAECNMLRLVGLDIKKGTSHDQDRL